jgi:hypothetical protein
MSNDFIPLFPAIRAQLAGSAPAGFSPVVQSAPSSNLRVPQVSSPASTPPPHSEVKVEIKRDGQRISLIRIHCKCGEVVEIDCEY